MRSDSLASDEIEVTFCTGRGQSSLIIQVMMKNAPVRIS